MAVTTAREAGSMSTRSQAFGVAHLPGSLKMISHTTVDDAPATGEKSGSAKTHDQ
jgi:hypothetical protein